MTVKELKEKLNQFPDDTEVEIDTERYDDGSPCRKLISDCYIYAGTVVLS